MFKPLNFTLRAFLLAGTCVYLPALENVAHAQTSCNEACPQWAEARIKSDRMTQRAERAAATLPLVIQALAEEDLAPEWVYLMLEESGGDPSVKSSAGAVGLWQLMPATAKRYGCEDPEDPVDATHAAAKYIKKLMHDFKNDPCDVVMAYNMGGTNLRRNGPTQAARSLAALVSCAFCLDPLILKEKE